VETLKKKKHMGSIPNSKVQNQKCSKIQKSLNTDRMAQVENPTPVLMGQVMSKCRCNKKNV
jgi:hypothetical protein